jgi:hypothetical protein
LKYLISPPWYQILRRRLRYLLQPDPYAGPNGDYQITSLYFDDIYDSALHEKLSGVQNREKVRLRIYNSKDDVIMLEKKIKKGDGVCKERLRIDKQMYTAVINGDVDTMRQSGHPLLDSIAWQMKHQLLRPKVIVDYCREAYVYKQGNVRITFDKRLRSGITNLNMFCEAPLAPALTSGMTILEVKFDEFLPSMVQDLLQATSFTRQAASKYVLCRALAKTHSWEDQ